MLPSKCLGGTWSSGWWVLPSKCSGGDLELKVVGTPLQVLGGGTWSSEWWVLPSKCSGGGPEAQGGGCSPLSALGYVCEQSWEESPWVSEQGP